MADVQGLPFGFCLNPDTGLLLPDLTLYLTLSPDVASQRGQYGEERYETLSMQTKVREQFGLVAEQVRLRHGTDKWVEVSADGTMDQVEGAIWSLVAAVEPSERGRLWT
jgi:dTMP kinase